MGNAGSAKRVLDNITNYAELADDQTASYQMGDGERTVQITNSSGTKAVNLPPHQLCIGQTATVRATISGGATTNVTYAGATLKAISATGNHAFLADSLGWLALT